MISETEHLARLAALHADSWPAGRAREVSFPLGEIALSDHLRHWGKVRPEVPAVIYYGRAISYAELDAAADRFAGLLAGAGIGKGDRVAVFLPNCPQFHIAFYGILRLGAVHCPVSPMSTAFELEHHLRDTGARALVAQDALMPVARAAMGAGRVETVWTTALSEMAPARPTMDLPPVVAAAPVACPDARDLLTDLAGADRPDFPPADPHALAALNYTGGTTGLPKGCMHSQHHMLWTAASNWSVTRGSEADEASAVALSLFPEFWIAGENAALIMPVFAGRPVVLMTRWDPVAVMQGVAAHGVTQMALTVDGAVELLDHPRFGEFDLSSLRRVRVVSFIRKLDRAVRARWKAATGTVLAESAWGMTETHTSNTFTAGMQDDDFDLKQEPIFVGLPVPGNDFKICDFDSGAILPIGAEGEICVRGPAIMSGYWGRPEATAEALRDGWLHSGDIGRIGPGGHLHYLGRRKEMLKVRGMSVFPAEIEAVLATHPAVAACGVIGRSDPRAGQVPVAFVQLRAGEDAEGLDAWLAERLAAYKRPEVRVLEAMPLTATGKVKKTALSDLLPAVSA